MSPGWCPGCRSSVSCQLSSPKQAETESLCDRLLERTDVLRRAGLELRSRWCSSETEQQAIAAQWAKLGCRTGCRRRGEADGGGC